MDIELTEERMARLATIAEEHSLKAAQETIVGANPDRAQKLYDKWRKVAVRDQPHDADAFLAIAMLIANYIGGQDMECPHCRRFETAKLFALAHYINEYEGGRRSGTAVN